MLRVLLAVLGTSLLAARLCILGGLGLGAALCAGYALYGFLRYGGFPETSLASLYPGVFEYLLPPRHLLLNTIFITCVRLPLAAFTGLLFGLAMLLDKLGQALVYLVERLSQAEKAG